MRRSVFVARPAKPLPRGSIPAPPMGVRINQFTEDFFGDDDFSIQRRQEIDFTDQDEVVERRCIRHHDCHLRKKGRCPLGVAKYAFERIGQKYSMGLQKPVHLVTRSDAKKNSGLMFSQSA